MSRPPLRDGLAEPEVTPAQAALRILDTELDGLAEPEVTPAQAGPDHPNTAIGLDNLAVTYRELGQAGDALPLQQRALQITETTLGPSHPDTAIQLDNLAGTYRALGQPDEAVPLEERARQIREERSAQTGGPE